MAPLSWVRPVSTPHKTWRFWLLVGLDVVVVLSAPLIQMLLGFPLLPLRVQLISGTITFVLLITVWFGVRFVLIAWVAIALFFLLSVYSRQVHDYTGDLTKR
jgi:hypothetical protein